jgi:hypothetical protein
VKASGGASNAEGGVLSGMGTAGLVRPFARVSQLGPGAVSPTV